MQLMIYDYRSKDHAEIIIIQSKVYNFPYFARTHDLCADTIATTAFNSNGIIHISMRSCHTNKPSLQFHRFHWFIYGTTTERYIACTY